MTINDDLLWLIKPASVTGNINFNYSASTVLITHTGPFYRVIKIRQDNMSMHASGKCEGREGGRSPFVGQREEVSEGGGGSCFVMSAPPS